MRRQLLAGLALVAGLVGNAWAGRVTVAVAANFNATASTLAESFEAMSGHVVVLVVGSTGKLHAQISNGAPFDVLLAADSERPKQLEASVFGVSGSRFTYAFGRLVVWSPEPGLFSEGLAAGLLQPRVRHVAVANPALAPYGAAAFEVLEQLGLRDRLADRLVLGRDVADVHALVATGNAQVGFVARSLLPDALPDAVPDADQRVGAAVSGSMWLVPSDAHAPIRQDALLLAHGQDNPGALAFLAYLRGAAARAMIVRAGYGVE